MLDEFVSSGITLSTYHLKQMVNLNNKSNTGYNNNYPPLHRNYQHPNLHPLRHRQAESQEKQVADTGKHFDRDSHHRRKHRSLVRHESLASQDTS